MYSFEGTSDREYKGKIIIGGSERDRDRDTEREREREREGEREMDDDNDEIRHGKPFIERRRLSSTSVELKQDKSKRIKQENMATEIKYVPIE